MIWIYNPHFQNLFRHSEAQDHLEKLGSTFRKRLCLITENGIE